MYYPGGMHTAGLVLDLYDDPAGLRDIYASLDEVPEAVKVAHALTAEEREALPDTTYALVLLQDGDRLRKYACVDRGNTLLNVDCFLKHGHKLPVEAQKVAAANLVIACGWYDVDPPEELQKVAALGMGLLGTALIAPSVAKGTADKIKGNLAATQAGGGAVVTPAQQGHLGSMLKGAQVSGSPVMPHSAPSKAKVGEGASLSPYVDLRGKSPRQKTASARVPEHTAYQGRYPLDDYGQVKAASAYFDENWKLMTPEMRHSFAKAMVKRASQMGIPVSERARELGADSYAPDEQLKLAMELRSRHLGEAGVAVLEELLEKRAEWSADEFCAHLEAFDRQAMLVHLYDRAIPDAYASTYGLAKVAEEDQVWADGNDRVTREELVNFGATSRDSLVATYGDDMADEFQRDAWGVFKSLPLDQKRRIARMASGDSSG